MVGPLPPPLHCQKEGLVPLRLPTAPCAESPSPPFSSSSRSPRQVYLNEENVADVQADIEGPGEGVREGGEKAGRGRAGRLKWGRGPGS